MEGGIIMGTCFALQVVLSGRPAPLAHRASNALILSDLATSPWLDDWTSESVRDD